MPSGEVLNVPIINQTQPDVLVVRVITLIFEVYLKIIYSSSPYCTKIKQSKGKFLATCNHNDFSN